MPKRRKQIRNLILAALVLLLLGGGYLLAVRWEPKTDNGEGTPTAAANVISLFQAESDEVRAVSIQNPNQTYTLYQDDDGNLSIPELSDIPFQQISLKSAFSGFLTVTAERKITDDLSRAAEFGLDRGNASFTIQKKDGAKVRFLVGDNLPGESSYYMMQDGGDGIYALSSYKADALLQSTNSFRSKNLFSVSTDSITAFSVARGGETLLKTRLATEGEKPLNTYQCVWVAETPCAGEGASEDRIGTLLKNFASVAVSDFADDHPGDLNRYGLGNDAYVLTIETAADTYTMRIGAACENGVYFQCGSEPFVYIGDSAYLDAFSGFDPMQYIQKFVRIAPIDAVSSVEIQRDGRTMTLTIGDGDEEENEDKYQINGKTTKADNFKKIYQQVIGILFVNSAAHSEAADPFMTITYHFKDGSADTSRYFAYDERYYLAERSDGKCFTVLKSTLNDLFSTLDAAN